MEPVTFKTSWPEYINFTRKYNDNEIKKFWDELLVEMPEEVRLKLSDLYPELEIYPKERTSSMMFCIPYVFTIPDISNSNGINKFLENYVINVCW